MSRIMAALFAALCASGSAAHAQQAYGPAADVAGEEKEDAPDPLTASQPCETQAQEDGVILVCRELTDDERYRSPIPREVQSDRIIIPGLTDPPCWVTNPEAVGTLACMRFGYAPEPAIMVDLTVFPEPLAEADAALVTAAEGEARARPITGERVAIDISEDE